MTNEERKQLVAIIESEISKLSKKRDELKDLVKPVAPDDAIGHISRMDAINNKSIVEASMRNIETRLNQLQKISQVVHDKEYGHCTKCHKPIHFERLKIRPEIWLCACCLKR
ncbi:MAG: TraR/DksA family transcriptional regulator [Prolixibacteraceae bacterium]|nr:TraR/DksA family transcriptional regulator [Prolixibacteraceae bacterium]